MPTIETTEQTTISLAEAKAILAELDADERLADEEARAAYEAECYWCRGTGLGTTIGASTCGACNGRGY